MKIYKKIAVMLSLTYTLSAAGAPMHVYSAAAPEATPQTNVQTSSPPETTAQAAVLIDADSGIILYQSNKDTQKFPASITKIMTALLALDHTGANLDQRITFSIDAVTLPYGSSHIAMSDGETLTMEQALYALMLESANEVANAIAEHIGGTTEQFGYLMTNKAMELGALNTNFTNPHGLHSDTHYTTAYDMALIMQEAVKYPKFLEIIATKSLSIPPTEKKTEDTPLNNSHKMLYAGNTYYYEYVIGGKTGFTDEAGNTLVTYAEKNGAKLISVVLQEEGFAAAYTDTKNLFEYGFNMNYSDTLIFDNQGFTETINIIEEKDGETIELGTISVMADTSITLNLPDTINPANIVKDIQMEYRLEPPVYKNQAVGTMTLLYDNVELATVNLVSADDFYGETEPAMAAAPMAAAENSGSKITLALVLKTVLISAGILFGLLFAIGVTSRVIKHFRRKKRLERRRRARARARARALRPAYEEDYQLQYRYKN